MLNKILQLIIFQVLKLAFLKQFICCFFILLWQFLFIKKCYFPQNILIFISCVSYKKFHQLNKSLSLAENLEKISTIKLMGDMWKFFHLTLLRSLTIKARCLSLKSIKNFYLKCIIALNKFICFPPNNYRFNIHNSCRRKF